MRGKLLRRPRLACPARIIPAHAGQTMTFRPIRRATPDHPRACGANDYSLVRTPETPGSSPRMRGKHQHRTANGAPHRIIPAHAGQTARPCTSSADLTDHPRACGANSAFCFLASASFLAWSAFFWASCCFLASSSAFFWASASACLAAASSLSDACLSASLAS